MVEPPPSALPSSDGAPFRGADCRLCPRLAEFLDKHRAEQPGWHNAPVNGHGPLTAPILLVGLAPGLRGANRTGRPFTGDFAGDLLFSTLDRFGLSAGVYDARPDDGLELTGIRIVNSVRCVPPKNKPSSGEINTCRPFLVQDIAAMPRLKVIVTLGRIAHSSAMKALGLKERRYPFGHAKRYRLPNGKTLIASYHCSRYNTNTGKLTPDMFHDVFKKAVTASGIRAPVRSS